jgi:hypothetical protein
MLYSLKVYAKGGWVRYSFLVSLVLNIFQWVWVIYNSRYINKDIAFVLHTNILAGANWYDQWWMVYLFPVVGVVGLFSQTFCLWRMVIHGKISGLTSIVWMQHIPWQWELVELSTISRGEFLGHLFGCKGLDWNGFIVCYENLGA